ncbi:calcineurin subunit B isoform X2 [Phoenix dactylifera]|uniref:Calcineurin subunit B isoform X2 n=1 Tax=Phoenix dactylifera TaxID=42345 RepID=A0A8B8J982_PHODC|nr:calcineurin subunit B isoform X2 [Phoenix dactylifera]
MGNASSMLTQYDIEEVQEHCNYLISQQEIVSLYQRFCQLDRNAKGFISADEFLSIPEFALNPLSQLLKMVDGLNFKDFVAFLSTFSSKASLEQKIELLFKVYDIDSKGKVTFKDLLEVLRDLTGSFMSEEQREKVLSQVLEEAGYSRNCSLLLEDFVKLHSETTKSIKIKSIYQGSSAGLIPAQAQPGKCAGKAQIHSGYSLRPSLKLKKGKEKQQNKKSRRTRTR